MELSNMSQAYYKQQFRSNSRYVSVSSFDDATTPGSEQEEPLRRGDAGVHAIDLRRHPQLSERRSWIKTFGIQVFGLLWLAPVVFLLILNVKGHIIGASAWCPGGKCYPDAFDPRTTVPQQLLAKYDRYNHNLLGALQLVSKALEVWFILISSWLVYLFTMFLAGQKPGLPIAYLTRPSEFAELAGLFDPLLWSTLPGLHEKPGAVGARKARKRVWLFIFSTVGLCILCNLMGPATAVLVLPALQWVETAKVENNHFIMLNSDNPPYGDTNTWYNTANCTDEEWNNEQYSCISGTALDSWIEVYTASQDSWNGISQQDMVSFNFNMTYMSTKDGELSDVVYWAPSRQIMSSLSDDWFTVRDISLGFDSDSYESYTEYNNSVQVFISRNGPTVGVISNMWLGYDNLTWWDTFIGQHQGVRCYEGYNISETPLTRGTTHGNYTKCVKFGSGWNTSDFTYKYESFTVEGMYKAWLDIFGPSLTFETWTSDKAAFFPNGTLPTNFDPKCLVRNENIPKGTVCDWDAFFTTDPTLSIYNRSIESTTIHISGNFEPVEGHPTTVDLMLDFVAFQAFTEYSLDPSLLTNPLLLTSTPNLPTSGKPISVDPAWTLAAWSVDSSGSIGANRTASLALLHAFDMLWDTEYYEDDQPLWKYWPLVDYISFLPVIQTLSLIEYYDNSTMNSTTPEPAIDADHPLLTRHARMNVWAYGMSSRTAWVGVLVACAGCVVVIVQFIFGVVDRRRYRSPTQLLVAALEHSYNAEFDGKHDEKAIAKTPFRVEDAHRTETGKIRFSRTF